MKQFLALLILFVTGFTTAQTGNITGKVLDKYTKQPLAGATVLLAGSTTGTTANEKGIYLFQQVPENVYKIKVSHIGYTSVLETDIRVVREKTFQVKDVELAEATIQGREVTISSGYMNDLMDAPVSSYSYSKDEIIRAPGAAGDIFRAIEVLPGVNSSGGEFSSFSVRGSAPRDNIILIDNIPFSNISHFTESGGTEEIQGGRFSIFTMGLVEKANFQAGGFSAKFGGKKASFLDLSIKEGNKESPTVNGSYDLMGWEANYDGPAYFLKNSSIVASARAQDFKQILDMMGEIGHGHPKLADYLFKITTDVDANNKLSFLGLYSTEEFLREVYHIYKAKDFSNRALSNQTEDKTLFGLNWRALCGKNGFLKTAAYYSRTNQNQQAGRAYPEAVNGIIPSEENVYVRNPIGIYDSDESQYGLKSDLCYTLSPIISLNTGFLYQIVNKNSSTTMNGIDTLYVFNRSEATSPNRHFLVIDPAEVNNRFSCKRAEMAGFADIGIKLYPNMHINAGARYEYDNYSKKNYLSPRFSSTWQFHPLTSLNVAAGLNYQLPEMLTLSADKRNTGLKSEKAFHYIIGLTRYIGDDIKLCAETYYKDLHDLIVQPNSNTEYSVNSGKGYSYGVDLSATKRFVDNFYGQINYSYGVCKVKDNSSEGYYNYHFNQPHVFNILAGFQLNDNWSFSARWKYATGLPRDEFVIYSNIFNDPAKMRYSKEITSKNTLRYNDFHSLNMRVDYRHQFAANLAVIAYLDLLNAYDQNNQLADLFIETTGKNDFESLSFMPTFGVKIEI